MIKEVKIKQDSIIPIASDLQRTCLRWHLIVCSFSQIDEISIYAIEYTQDHDYLDFLHFGRVVLLEKLKRTAQ